MTLRVLVMVVVGTIYSLPVMADSPASPCEVTKAYYEALNVGDFDKIKSFYTAHLMVGSQMIHLDPEFLAKYVDPATHGHSIVKVETFQLNTRNVRDGTQWVRVLVHYKDGGSQWFGANLRSEAGTWKILWGNWPA